ncbi:MAG: deoxyribonuclease V [Verrucomicrobia bacterium]|nr:deoxyribonuclease V [Verrucomicrobiota bacterium]
MDFPPSWLFPVSTADAISAQAVMAQKVIQEDVMDIPSLIGGMDVSNNLYDPEQMIHASAVVLSYPSLQVIDEASVSQKQTFPYIPGLLGFRESPALFEAFQRLRIKPEVLMIDGHGVSHPRGLGIASHLGVLLDMPTVGVAKSILVGKPAGPLGAEAGAQIPLLWKGRILGMLLRTKVRSNPLIISAGHKIALPTAVKLVQSCLQGYRLPEVTRQAHLAANACRKSYLISSATC